MNSFRHYPLFLLSLLYMSLAIGIIGCSDDDDEKVYPALVQPSISGVINIQPDSTMLVNAGVFLQFRGGGNDLLVPEDESPGCFGTSSSDSGPVYELGNPRNLDSATVSLNGFPLVHYSEGKYYPGPRYEMPEDSFLVLQDGDVLHLEYDVPNEEEEPMEDIVLSPQYYPYMPANNSTIGLNDTLTLPLYGDYFFSLRTLQGRGAIEEAATWQTPEGLNVIQYVLNRNEVVVGDTLRFQASWGGFLGFGISSLNYFQHCFLIVTE